MILRHSVGWPRTTGICDDGIPWTTGSDRAAHVSRIAENACAYWHALIERSDARASSRGRTNTAWSRPVHDHVRVRNRYSPTKVWDRPSRLSATYSGLISSCRSISEAKHHRTPDHPPPRRQRGRWKISLLTKRACWKEPRKGGIPRGRSGWPDGTSERGGRTSGEFEGGWKSSNDAEGRVGGGVGRREIGQRKYGARCYAP